jgi:hypothetical protein
VHGCTALSPAAYSKFFSPFRGLFPGEMRVQIQKLLGRVCILRGDTDAVSKKQRCCFAEQLSVDSTKAW